VRIYTGTYEDIDRVMENQADLVEPLHTLKQVPCVKACPQKAVGVMISAASPKLGEVHPDPDSEGPVDGQFGAGGAEFEAPQ